MKKRILALSMCFVLSATASLAQAPSLVTQKEMPKVNVAKSIVTPEQTSTLPVDVKKSGEKPKMLTRQEAKKFFEAKRAKEKERLYNSLQLTAEQRAKAEAADLKSKAEAAPLIKKFQIESKKLRDLKAKKASSLAIWKQETIVKNAKKDVNEHFNESRKNFDAILTKEQKAKYKEINEIRAKEMQEHRKKYGKKGMGSNHMGPPEGIGPKGPHGPMPMGPPSEINK